MRIEDVRVGDYYTCNEAPSGRRAPGPDPSFVSSMNSCIGESMKCVKIDTTGSRRWARLISDNRSDGWWWHSYWIVPAVAPPASVVTPTTQSKCCTSIWGCPECRLYKTPV